MLHILESYGLELNNRKKMCCPFHNEKTPSFGLYSNANNYKCFGCGESGDVISFVQKMENCDFQRAIEIIDTKFALMLFKKPTLTQKRKADALFKAHKENQEIERQKLEYTKFAYNKLCEYHRWLIRQEPTDDIIHDIEFMQRLLEKYLDRDSIIEFDVTALLNALKTKFCDMSEVEEFATGY